MPVLTDLAANSWIGYVICYIAIMGIYYSNAWNVGAVMFSISSSSNSATLIQSLDFPMLSTSLFSQNGTIYNQRAVFGSTFSLNETALAEVGLPALTGVYHTTMIDLQYIDRSLKLRTRVQCMGELDREPCGAST